ncbi:MAG: hypothetical protein CM15mP42_08940 [Methanobacteriota archaeon]|nr:MAG: hypothetical protein CM15mP42_08940 [Euryarchaeota archaeon]
MFLVDLEIPGNSEIVSDYFYLGQKEYLDVFKGPMILGLWLGKNFSILIFIGILAYLRIHPWATLAFGESKKGAMWLDSLIIDFFSWEKSFEKTWFP